MPDTREIQDATNSKHRHRTFVLTYETPVNARPFTPSTNQANPRKLCDPRVLFQVFGADAPVQEPQGTQCQPTARVSLVQDNKKHNTRMSHQVPMEQGPNKAGRDSCALARKRTWLTRTRSRWSRSGFQRSRRLSATRSFRRVRQPRQSPAAEPHSATTGARLGH